MDRGAWWATVDGIVQESDTVYQRVTEIWTIFATLGIGFVAYGLSIFFYVYAQRNLGASRTSAYYAIAPFIGVLLSLIVFKALPNYTFFIALALMVVGAWLCSKVEG